jgi:rod shape-determining protein MreC
LKALIQFLRRSSHLLLFLALEGLCFYLIARNGTMQGADILSSANALSGSLYQKQSDVALYFKLPSENDSLQKENARLRTQLAQLLYEADTLRDSSGTISYTEPAASGSLDSSRIVRYAKYIYRTARVVNNSVSERNNFLTLARGTQDGVYPGQAVISGTGVVGKVVYAKAHFAAVISLLSDHQPVSGILKDGTLGIVRWRYGSAEELEMENIPGDLKVYRGDSVMTTAYSFAPPDVLIGRVEKLRRNKRNNTQTLLLRPGANFRKLQYVYAVENSLAEERKAVEDSAREKILKPVTRNR